MQRTKRLLITLVLLLVVGAAVLFAIAPRETVNLSADFEPRKFGEGVQVYFEATESAFDDIVKGTEKRVIWRDGFKERRTPLSILYVHGFSATSEEIRPVPDKLAEALDANLVYTRLAGHGRSGAAMGTATAQDWMQDMAEGLAAARAVGERVIVLSTSTGGTLAAAAALDPKMSAHVAAMIFVSPNFGINNSGARLLTLPGAEWWVPLIVGKTRSFEAENDAQARFWTASYPTRALLPMAALVKTVVNLPLEQVAIPAFFWLSAQDQVVRADIAQTVAARWGGPATIELVEITASSAGFDSSAHVIAGDIMSPAGTQPAVDAMLAWLGNQQLDR